MIHPVLLPQIHRGGTVTMVFVKMEFIELNTRDAHLTGLGRVIIFFSFEKPNLSKVIFNLSVCVKPFVFPCLPFSLPG